MRTLKGHSTATTGAVAVSEATHDWSETPDIVFAFCSAQQDAEAVATALTKRFPTSEIVGCTTSGEHQDGAHYRNTLVVTGLVDSGICWVSRRHCGLSGFDDQSAQQLVAGLLAEFDTDTDSFEPDDYVALLFIDGLSLAEERVTALLDAALGGVRMAGGSAGDDLAFSQTQVLHSSGASSDAFVLVLARKNGVPVEILKHQHFTRDAASLVITRADPESRRVYEIDGYPAVTAYAAAIGLRAEELTEAIAFEHPVMLAYHGELYVRSVQKLHDDGSISFYCAIEEGMVLEVGSHDDMARSLGEDLDALNARIDGISFMLGFNCILRALEAEGAQAHESLGHLFAQHTPNMVGFDTYGEQLDGLHMNQTLVAVAIGGNQ